MKILLVSKHFWPENFRINIIANHLSKKNYIEVLCEEPSYNKFKHRYKLNKNIKINRFWTYPRKKSLFSIFLNYLSFIVFGSFKIFRMNTSKFDLVFTYATSPIFQAIPSIIYSKTKKIPSFLWVQDLWPEVIEDLNILKNKFLIFMIKILTKIIYLNTNYIFAQSISFKKTIQKLSKKKVDLLYNPEIKQNFKFYIKKKKKKNLKIIFAGNIGKAQNLKILIPVCQNLFKENIEFNIFGTGSEEKNLKKIIKGKSLDNIIKILKPVSPQKLKNKIKECDGLLLVLGKGKALSKTIPAKLQTYISFGKPIVVSADGEVKSLIDKYKLGFSSKSNDINGLTKSIIKLKKLSNIQKIHIYERSKLLFNSKFELNKWIFDLNEKLRQNNIKYNKERFII